MRYFFIRVYSTLANGKVFRLSVCLFAFWLSFLILLIFMRHREVFPVIHINSPTLSMFFLCPNTGNHHLFTFFLRDKVLRIPPESREEHFQEDVKLFVLPPEMILSVVVQIDGFFAKDAFSDWYSTNGKSKRVWFRETHESYECIEPCKTGSKRGG